ncbi:MAG: hypothetical protein U1E02_20925 [Hydrogenophaga sp.]|jgi:hypothetical protein|uniref:hypothetical protein n=1 Tax=Hydrogenophaga sp. TaxID=1904254 RepID=UPI001FED0B2B|nr:hypothetical protein [Hydrogenophaga sp.]MDP3627908.1 hypothetical protein [Hydrogenophaga sp.]MDZ4101251.1 hypothetical protein [Hydrogenophaga sp.]MDZ4126616.1 hypothetical protein [Hydrogenophaga sp.]MDZ4281513.1 hypothetical protein [Hydrogenophaga sp.]
MTAAERSTAATAVRGVDLAIAIAGLGTAATADCAAADLTTPALPRKAMAWRRCRANSRPERVT